ncbi:lipoprotein insertase outer membrane protein LolB [Luteibacter aegosomaticola]|uniref:lipoprotein insertase outer membrane protein LolB n=1 Tax=Luteibacter aegosomaticola TaxID=2911538 RepID=UPI001FFB1981|nr:lipoprotein insertase outer membrane protein LolB [Luteibacter aegosomaticola]UPG91227.1 lipoprotein insertase outer membrane protein LolB [Luteibacter aegosomaticola]
MTGWFRGLGLVSVVLLSACATTRPVTHHEGDGVTLGQQADRERVLADTNHWTLQGKLSVSDGNDNHSGGLTWKQDGDRYEFTIRAPVTGRSFRLTGGPDGAELDGLDGGPRRGPNAETLMAQTVGWQLPMAELKSWVLGLRADAGPADIRFGDDRLPSQLVQDGWTVDYKAWDATRQPAMPSKVFAEKPPYKVRLAIESWQLGQ